MEKTLHQFFQILRRYDVEVTTTEAVDALQAVRLLGYGNRHRLKAALGGVLAKSEEEKSMFNDCFEGYFRVPEE
ncbi:MAG TPA: VWA containing CoxE family protein, partial [Gammaproteobacteria bacterium]|nr:VWA containing CoxE family protein [Gammaproteobacteria bacterium]